MKPRTMALIGSAVLFSQLANCQSSPLPIKREDILPACTFAGNSDFYGIGVRLGFYLQWFSGLLAFVVNPAESEAQADAQTIFILSNLIGLLILQIQDAADVNVVVPVILFYMFFGGSVSAVTTATTSLMGWRSATSRQKIAIVTRQVLVQVTFVATLAYSFYFWIGGFKKFKKFPDECGGTFVFPDPHRVFFREAKTGVTALALLVAFYLLIWLVSYMRLRSAFPSHVRVGSSKSGLNPRDGERPLAPWKGKQLKWTLIGGCLISIVLVWSVAGIELTIKYNHVTDVNDLGSTGQLIPFIIGLASFPPAIWGALGSWLEVKEEEAHELKETKIESQELLRSPRAEQLAFSMVDQSSYYSVPVAHRYIN